MRRAARKDDPQAAIVAALRKIGVRVFILNNESLGDLLVYDARGRSALGNPWLMIEVKAKGKRLTPAQEETFQVAPFPVVSTVSEALQLFGVKLPH